MADWEKIKAEYITTDISVRDLAQKHGVHYTTIGKKASIASNTTTSGANTTKTKKKKTQIMLPLILKWVYSVQAKKKHTTLT